MSVLPFSHAIGSPNKKNRVSSNIFPIFNLYIAKYIQGNNINNIEKYLTKKTGEGIENSMVFF